MARMVRDPETSLLLDLLAEAFERKSWHGTNLRGSFRGMTGAEAAWKADLALLVTEHRALVAAVAERLPTLSGAARAKALHLVRGAAAHDLYHAGQVQLLKRLRPTA